MAKEKMIKAEVIVELVDEFFSFESTVMNIHEWDDIVLKADEIMEKED